MQVFYPKLVFKNGPVLLDYINAYNVLGLKLAIAKVSK